MIWFFMFEVNFFELIALNIECKNSEEFLILIKLLS